MFDEKELNTVEGDVTVTEKDIIETDLIDFGGA